MVKRVSVYAWAYGDANPRSKSYDVMTWKFDPPKSYFLEQTAAVDPSASWTEHIHWELMPYTVPIGLLTEGTCTW